MDNYFLTLNQYSPVIASGGKYIYKYMSNKIWEDKIKDAKTNLLLATKELELATLELAEKKNITGIENWIGYIFESSSTLTPEYANFDKQVKKYIQSRLDKALELVKWSRQHFEFSGFIKNNLTRKYCYFSCSDVRFFPDAWYNNLLIRTAKNDKDYTGGSNDWSTLPNLNQKALLITL